MKPCMRKGAPVSKINIEVDYGNVGKIAGVVKKLGIAYPHCRVVLITRHDCRMVKGVRSDQNGVYKFSGIPTQNEYFLVGFDKKQQFNAVIQDNVVPK